MDLIAANKKEIEFDIANIKKELKGKISKIGLFGSMLEKPISKANDIDLVIYCKVDYEEVKNELLQLKLDLPICPHKMNGTYGVKENDKKEKHYHIILLNSDNPNKEFERINKGKIVVV